MSQRERSRNYKRSPEEEQAALELEQVMNKMFGDPSVVPTDPKQLASHRLRAKSLFGFDRKTVTGPDGARVKADWTPAELADEERLLGTQEDIESTKRLVSLTAAGIDAQQAGAIDTGRDREIMAVTQLARAVLVRVADHPADDYFSEIFRPRYQKEENALLEILRRTIFRSAANWYDYEDESGVVYRNDGLREFEERREADLRLHQNESYEDRERRREREDFERVETYGRDDWELILTTEAAVCLEFLQRRARILTTDFMTKQTPNPFTGIILSARSLTELLPEIEKKTGLKMDFAALLDATEIPDNIA